MPVYELTWKVIQQWGISHLAKPPCEAPLCTALRLCTDYGAGVSLGRMIGVEDEYSLWVW